MRRVLLGTVVCSLVVGSAIGTATATPSGRGRPFPAPVRTQLDSIVALAQGMGVPGVAVAVDRPGAGSYVATVGTRDGHRPVNPATKFRIGSVTKTFTGTVILQLVDRGLLSLDDTLDTWQPSVQEAGRITIRMLLNMTSGIFDEGGPGSTLVAESFKDPLRVWSPQEIVDLAISQWTGAQPGATWSYSDTNYIILGMIAEAVTGTPIGGLIEQQILRPLHLNDTSYPTTTTIPPPAATAFLVEIGEGHVPATVFDPSVYGAAGAMVSTVKDLQVWARALGNGALLSPVMRQERLAFVPTGVEFLPLVASDPGLPVRYGLGVAEAGTYLGHNGLVSGFSTDVWYDPGTDTTIVVCLNAQVYDDSLQFVDVADGMFASFADILAAS